MFGEFSSDCDVSVIPMQATRGGRAHAHLSVTHRSTSPAKRASPASDLASDPAGHFAEVSVYLSWCTCKTVSFLSCEFYDTKLADVLSTKTSHLFV